MANFNFNKVILGGRLTADPELKTTPSGVPVTSFNIAVNRRSRNGAESAADFFSVIAWRSTAEFVARYFKKASSICVTGSIQTKNWTDQNGQTHHGVEIQADEVFFVDSKAQSPAGSFASNGFADAPASAPTYSNMPADAEPKFEEVADDDDLPF